MADVKDALIEVTHELVKETGATLDAKGRAAQDEPERRGLPRQLPLDEGDGASRLGEPRHRVVVERRASGDLPAGESQRHYGERKDGPSVSVDEPAPSGEHYVSAWRTGGIDLAGA